MDPYEEYREFLRSTYPGAPPPPPPPQPPPAYQEAPYTTNMFTQQDETTETLLPSQATIKINIPKFWSFRLRSPIYYNDNDTEKLQPSKAREPRSGRTGEDCFMRLLAVCLSIMFIVLTIFAVVFFVAWIMTFITQGSEAAGISFAAGNSTKV